MEKKQPAIILNNEERDATRTVSFRQLKKRKQNWKQRNQNRTKSGMGWQLRAIALLLPLTSSPFLIADR